MQRRRPAIIAHRGASGYRPEHTLAAYRLAIAQGADFIEPDLVATRDGVLIARHEPALAVVQLAEGGEIATDVDGAPLVVEATTDVAARPEFRDRLTVKFVDGVAVGGWFAEDFTLAEIKQLRARERIPDIRPGNVAFNDLFEVPTLDEVIALIRRCERETGTKVGLYPETKHPTYFATAGAHLGGEQIAFSLGTMLIETLVAHDFTDPERVFIQSFEVANLIELKTRVMPAAGVDLPLIQLLGSLDARAGDGTWCPYDALYHAAFGSDPATVYGELAEMMSARPPDIRRALASEEGLGAIARTYAAGIGPCKTDLLLRAPLRAPVDCNGDGRPGVTSRLTGEIGDLLRCAKRAHLLVHPYTLRAEEQFLALSADGGCETLIDEVMLLLRLGVDGLFIDQPDLGVAGRARFEAAAGIAPRR